MSLGSQQKYEGRGLSGVEVSAFGASTDSNLLCQYRQPLTAILVSPCPSRGPPPKQVWSSAQQCKDSGGETCPGREMTTGLCHLGRALPSLRLISFRWCVHSSPQFLKHTMFTFILCPPAVTVGKRVSHHVVYALTGSRTPTEHCKHIRFLLTLLFANELLALSNPSSIFLHIFHRIFLKDIALAKKYSMHTYCLL